MKTNFVNVYDLANIETKDLFCGIQTTMERVMNGGDELMTNYLDALDYLEEARGYCFDILDDIDDDKQEDNDELIRNVVEAYITLIDANITLITMCNQGA